MPLDSAQKQTILLLTLYGWRSSYFGWAKKKYYDTRSDLDKKTQLFLGAKQDLINLNIECIDTHDLITKSINRLQQIALNKTVFES